VLAVGVRWSFRGTGEFLAELTSDAIPTHPRSYRMSYGRD
jgi:hypothetical protein